MSICIWRTRWIQQISTRDSISACGGSCGVILQYFAFVVKSAARSILDQIPLGSSITEINGLPTKEYLEQEYGRYVGCYTHGRREDKLAEKMLLSEGDMELTVSGFTPEGTEFRVSLLYSEQRKSARKLAQGDDLSREVKNDKTTYDSFSSYVVDDTIYVAVLPDFGNAAMQEEFASWIDETRGTATAYILDARGNGGGSDVNARAVLRHFIVPEDMGIMMGYKQYVDPTRVTTATSMLESIDKLEPGLALEQYCLDGLAMYEHRYYLPYNVGISTPPSNNGSMTDDTSVSICDQPVVILTDWNCGSAGDTLQFSQKVRPM